jgi:hypothetical protein
LGNRRKYFFPFLLFLSNQIKSERMRHERRDLMAEEHRCEAPEGHQLTTNNCGFFGSPTTLNLCSKCYRELHHSLNPPWKLLSLSLSLNLSPPFSSSPLANESLPSPPYPLVLTLPKVVRIHKHRRFCPKAMMWRCQPIRICVSHDGDRSS